MLMRCVIEVGGQGKEEVPLSTKSVIQFSIFSSEIKYLEAGKP